jgi:hypothetical protein
MPRRGLTVGAQGQLLRDGVRFRNIGLNYGGGIVRIYSQPSATACEYTPGPEQDAVLDRCVEMGVKVLRVKATPYWPAQWRYGVNGGVAGVAAVAADRQAHYIKIDQFLAKCRARGIGVILTLFFRHASVSDLAGQTVRAGWLTPGSATRNFAQALTQEIVTRYLTEDAVYGYEWSNEVNHYNDATDATLGNFPGVNTGYGSRASYPAVDTSFRGNDLADVIAWWYGVVRAIDSQRIVMTGNGPNSYTLESGVPGIPGPMFEWHRQQVRDNPTNCGSIHYYGNVGYGSPGFRGLDAVLTGARHWQRVLGRGFVLGEFGNQPWRVTALAADGATLTVTCGASCPIDVGDPFLLGGINSTFNGAYTVRSINAARTTITADCSVSGSWSGAVDGLQHVTGDRVTRMCSDIISSGVDVALFWAIDRDPLVPIWQAVEYPGNEGQIAAITAANQRLSTQ